MNLGILYSPDEGEVGFESLDARVETMIPVAVVAASLCEALTVPAISTLTSSAGRRLQGNQLFATIREGEVNPVRRKNSLGLFHFFCNSGCLFLLEGGEDKCIRPGRRTPREKEM